MMANPMKKSREDTHPSETMYLFKRGMTTGPPPKMIVLKFRTSAKPTDISITSRTYPARYRFEKSLYSIGGFGMAIRMMMTAVNENRNKTMRAIPKRGEP